MEEVALISWTQKLVLYETKARYYIVGSNKSESRFRVLKIDRTEPRELVIHDDKVEYSKEEIRSVLSMIDGGNKPKKQGNQTGLSKNISAFGIAGFVRFLEGYYIVLITKRKKAAVIGPHTIYRIEDTSMLYIPNDSVRINHPDENRYLKMFQNVDLSSNFYFSYSYDVTHTLQYNMAPSLPKKEKRPDEKTNQSKETPPSRTTQRQNLSTTFPSFSSFPDLTSPNPDIDNKDIEADSESNVNPDNDKDSLPQNHEDFTTPTRESPCSSGSSDGWTGSPSVTEPEPTKIGVKTAPCRKFLWNKHLLHNFEGKVHSDWVIYIIHGFIGQANVCVFGKSVYLTVIGRRSSQFAGTRFLKRGQNLEGYVANEIETEQIVQDTAVSFFPKGKISSFVQMRGSVPGFWSQDISKMVPKPPITLDQRDPYSSAAGMHFNQLTCRYGAPIIVVNLVKTREKRRHESILSEDLLKTLEYLNQFLPLEHTIQYIGFDMARVTKRKDADVMIRLNRIARFCIKQTGLFLNNPHGKWMLDDPELQALKGVWSPTGCRQTGMVRTNCVDCLDRTNTAQFAVGRSALAYQLYALGVLEKPHLEFDTDCVKMLEELYEDHGDTVALQYGGSQLVHRIKGYRKIAPWTSHSRDILQTMSRYYSNAFSDLEKQQAFNLFLGVFVPSEGQANLWDLPTDYYLHNKVSIGRNMTKNHYCQWWDEGAKSSLPLPHDEVSKSSSEHAAVIEASETDEHVDPFFEHYRPEELSNFDDMYQIYLSQMGWKHVPKNASDVSPFCRRQFHVGGVSNPNVSGKASTSSNMSELGSDGSSDSSENSDGESPLVRLLQSDSSSDDSSDNDKNYISFKELFPSMATVYDTDLTEPSARDQKMYRRYVDIGQAQKDSDIPAEPSLTESESLRSDADVEVGSTSKKVPPGIDIYPISAFKLDSSFFVEPPPVSRQAKDIYAAYVQRGIHGAGPVSVENSNAYTNYVNKKYL